MYNYPSLLRASLDDRSVTPAFACQLLHTGDVPPSHLASHVRRLHLNVARPNSLTYGDLNSSLAPSTSVAPRRHRPVHAL
ncbi:uncharacterized protein TRAVEDRAFT_54631 [Trametes versicolor FP-101664 SS1]|uniref:Uncharacterized protein n=1 Tax=Trametes versicolor (strain FP-101664) TaxID=717944 RepID=R7S706_TRAVS|nr:uncharacterized protein TRAVEDRAFT_54631 [Trametes versicolor FP-101664 SS1]EIW51362.1 hypothetical protein TRAVEDRAFT_54631 [Trametes versicolor FP-101664 SS1]